MKITKKVPILTKKIIKKVPSPKKIIKKVPSPKKIIEKKVPLPKKIIEKKVLTKTQCIKVAALRKEGYSDLEEWMNDPNNLYVGRHGRIFIGGGDDKRIFHYPGSKWANPYKVGTKTGEYTLEESIKLYKEYLVKSKLIDKIYQLQGKNLGCFCDQSGDCHAKVLKDLIKT